MPRKTLLSDFDRGTMEDVLAMVARERLRQVEVEGFTAAHDDQVNANGELARAAAAYAVPDIVQHFGCRDDDYGTQDELWPWDDAWDKREKHNRFRQLEIACALLIAELEREHRKRGLELAREG